jgi:hypothetical protein
LLVLGIGSSRFAEILQSQREEQTPETTEARADRIRSQVRVLLRLFGRLPGRQRIKCDFRFVAPHLCLRSFRYGLGSGMKKELAVLGGNVLP